MPICEYYRYMGQQFAGAREEAGLTQGEVASILGLERTSITNFEAGRQRCNLVKIKNMCDVVGISLVSLLPDEMSKPPVSKITNKKELEIQRLEVRLAMLKKEAAK